MFSGEFVSARVDCLEIDPLVLGSTQLLQNLLFNARCLCLSSSSSSYISCLHINIKNVAKIVFYTANVHVVVDAHDSCESISYHEGIDKKNGYLVLFLLDCTGTSFPRVHPRILSVFDRGWNWCRLITKM